MGGHLDRQALHDDEERRNRLQHWSLRLRDPGQVAGGERQAEDQHQAPGGEEEWEDQEEKEVRGVRKLLALYSYSGEEDGSIKMELGEELEVLEEDVEGWSRVRRSEGGEEGFIPTSFTSPITDS